MYVTILQTLWGRLYKTSSANEKGTLYQLRNVINRKSVPKNPEKNMKSSEDFLLLIIHAHVIHAAKTIKAINLLIMLLILQKKSLVNLLFFQETMMLNQEIMKTTCSSMPLKYCH